MAEKKYDAGLEDEFTEIICCKCNVKLKIGSANLEYMGDGFPVDLPKCPTCGMVFIPEQLALGKMLHVEKSLEDK
jgi:hypothetical protein